MKKFAEYIGYIILATVFIAAFMAYFVTSTDSSTGIIHDGLGRPLYESPWLVRFVFGQEHLWAGWMWFIGDMIIFWGGIMLGSLLVKHGLSEKKP